MKWLATLTAILAAASGCTSIGSVHGDDAPNDETRCVEIHVGYGRPGSYNTTVFVNDERVLWTGEFTSDLYPTVARPQQWCGASGIYDVRFLDTRIPLDVSVQEEIHSPYMRLFVNFLDSGPELHVSQSDAPPSAA